ncbi:MULTISPECIES: hypothetical protein [unclassified Pseudomonas]|uniref:hypothetical protein n=1 Tax=unclassified Pseudomonas TaxID=196821 RepID=UPI000BC9C45E|nr:MULTISPECIES: hypothetical protein [unclassified Pseudomonas]PVZ19957.1 hypothetical protein F474_00548 [Pseudomonas sp. URIL14HWK12:I12]PVZ27023.1 hypothetical protein F470_00203 [Pseudomonas sp. URIL14HWK12:I10]PVZ37912.1 hypothetical protein F472_00548 [Pseudomonas sp. URIL14HWK12:I11]SNZ05171.1 hypothetical protein SAMN05660463_00856 [Pseudomonas sp. URIL14HWK12:I9]
MIYEVILDEFDIRCEAEIIDLDPRPSTWGSDWDFHGSQELEFQVVSGRRCSLDGKFTNLSTEYLEAVGLLYEEKIEAEIWRQYREQPQELAA